MPDREAWRIVACVPYRSGAKSSSIWILIRAWPFGVRVMSFTEPAFVPPIWTRSPFTSWAALRKYASTVYFLLPFEKSKKATTRIATITAPIAASRPATVVPRILGLRLLPDPCPSPRHSRTALGGGNLQKPLLVCAAFGWALANRLLRLG